MTKQKIELNNMARKYFPKGRKYNQGIECN